MRTKALALSLLGLLMIGAVPASAEPPPMGELYLHGEVVRTVIPPAANPQKGQDPIFVVMGDLDGQRPVAGVGPGDRDYHGGKWAVYVVTWNVTPYLLTSGDEVHSAETSGDVTVTRNADGDFKCPIQP